MSDSNPRAPSGQIDVSTLFTPFLKFFLRCYDPMWKRDGGFQFTSSHLFSYGGLFHSIV